MKKLVQLVLLLLFSCILYFGSLTFEASTLGLTIWFEKLVPSLLVAMVIIRMLDEQGALQSLSRLCFGWVQPIFHISSEAFSLVVASFFLGSPAGQILIDDYVKDERLTLEQGKRLGYCVNVSTPSFILITCGAVYLQSFRYGLMIWLGQFLAVLILLFLTRNTSISLARSSTYQQPNLFTSLRRGMTSAGTSLYFIGAYLIFSLVLLNLACMILPASWTLPLQCISEFSLGANNIAALSLSIPTKTILIGLILGFSSFSVHLQVLSLTPHLELSYPRYLLFRFFQTCLIGLFLYLFLMMAA